MSELITRREAIAKTALAAAATVAACSPAAAPPRPEPAESERREEKVVKSRMPAIYLPHGGGPWPFTTKRLFGGNVNWDAMERYMRGLGMVAPHTPKAILVISAHWEAAVPTVMTSPKPPMLYDYSGFPPETYEVQWPAPGAPEVAARAEALLEAAGISVGADARRGFDHGTFVPLALAFPAAEVPTFQLSLKRGLDPAIHLKMGRALAPLRDEGVLLVGSGMSYHNMRGFMTAMRGSPEPGPASKAFDDWLAESMALEASARETRLAEWEKAPSARACHPREEHLIPLHVVAGAAGTDAATLPYRDQLMGLHLSAVHFG